MKLNKKEYLDKCYACWIGKNIGGTMGTPYEGRREFQDIHGFVTEANVVLPNDDLDLQLVWLYAVERIGPRAVNAQRLGEFWLSFITPHWNEYGLGAANLRCGIPAPLSGDYKNNWSDSNGAWIRTEIWASLAPACPATAAAYAMEDASVDHGTGEGTTAAAFVAAMQSAAYAVPDLRRCIEIGLASIPQTSRVYKSVRLAIDCYENKVELHEARNRIQKSNADLGDGWFESPSNVGYTVLGLLYGEGDFKKSMIYAINCGDDTDCTGATVGATLGILGGTAAIPADWRAHLGDSIVTCSIAYGSMPGGVPKSCTELTARVAAEAPEMLIANRANVEFTDGATEIPADLAERFLADPTTRRQLELRQPFSFTVDFDYARAIVTLDGEPEINPAEEKRVHIRFINNINAYCNAPRNLTMRWLLPEGFTVTGRQTIRLPQQTAHSIPEVETDFVLRAGETVGAVNRAVLEVTGECRTSAAYIPVVLLG